MKVIIDRFEGEYAVCEKEDRTMINIKKDSIPEEARSGDVINIEGEKITIDILETEKRKKHIEDLIKNLWD